VRTGTPTHSHWLGAHDPRLQTAVRCLQAHKYDNVPPARRIAPASQLADFGLSEVMPGADTRPTSSDHAGSHPGTLTHMAPELLCVRLGAMYDAAAADAYAFGVAIWELWTGCRAYEGSQRALRLTAVGGAGLWRPSVSGGTTSRRCARRSPAGSTFCAPEAAFLHPSLCPGLSRSAVVDAVLRGTRPVFPPDAPTALAALARDCWAADPAARPAFPEVAARLEALA
jgi:hypothetical protein